MQTLTAAWPASLHFRAAVAAEPVAGRLHRAALGADPLRGRHAAGLARPPPQDEYGAQKAEHHERRERRRPGRQSAAIRPVQCHRRRRGVRRRCGRRTRRGLQDLGRRTAPSSCSAPRWATACRARAGPVRRPGTANPPGRSSCDRDSAPPQCRSPSPAPARPARCARPPDRPATHSDSCARRSSSGSARRTRRGKTASASRTSPSTNSSVIARSCFRLSRLPSAVVECATAAAPPEVAGSRSVMAAGSFASSASVPRRITSAAGRSYSGQISMPRLARRGLAVAATWAWTSAGCSNASARMVRQVAMRARTPPPSIDEDVMVARIATAEIVSRR